MGLLDRMFGPLPQPDQRVAAEQADLLFRADTSSVPFVALDALSDKPLQSVGAAWSEALRGAADMRMDLASPFHPARIDKRDNWYGMPWQFRVEA